MPTPRRLNRREFLAGAATGLGLLAACRDETAPAVDESYARLTSRPHTPSQTTTPGYHELGLFPLGRDGFYYVPEGYDPAVPAPLLILLHGGFQTDDVWRGTAVKDLMDELGAVLLAPESAGETWDFPVSNLYGPDVTFIDDALALVFDRCNIKSSSITLGGFSDGATEALGLGVINGDFFSSVMAFSPGGFQVPWSRGTPRVFVSHGTSDQILLPAWTRDFIVPELRRMGLTVEFVEFDGGHALPLTVFEPAVRSYITP